MQSTDRALIESLLADANRILLILAALDLRERNPLISPALRDSLQVYTQLQQYQATASLAKDESASVDEVLARLKSYLRYFGEDV